MAAEVLFEVRGALGVIRLNRPEAKNALNLAVVRQVLQQLQAWTDDPAVSQVLVIGAGDRGLCTRGDVRGIYEDIRATRQSERTEYATTEFFATEFRLNLMISQYPKPYIAFMDGATLGGGIGISARGRDRVVPERTKAGMPETTIGYFPDVGGTHLLARSPGHTGLHAGLTAGVFDAAEEVLERLAQQGAQHPDAARARETISSKSPTAVKLTLHGIRESAQLDLSAALVREDAAGQHQLRGHDVEEGIRAQIIEKDRSPRWQPAALREVDEATIAQSFLPGPHPPLELHPSAQEALS